MMLVVWSCDSSDPSDSAALHSIWLFLTQVLRGMTANPVKFRSCGYLAIYSIAFILKRINGNSSEIMGNDGMVNPRR